MPSVLCHTLICRDVIRSADSGEIASWSPLEQHAFIAGSWGPDLGVFPGTVPFLTDIAHYLGSGRLGRALWISAESRQERAFAAGWCLHVMADALIHPLINEGCGERIWGDRSRPCSWGESAAWHQRVEIGLDGYEWVRRCGGEFPARIEEQVRGLAERLMMIAYQKNYPGVSFKKEDFKKTVHAGFRGVRRLAKFTVVDGHRQLHMFPPLNVWPAVVTLYGPIKIATWLLGKRFRFHPLAETVTPAPWLEEAYRARVDLLIPRFLQALAEDFSGLIDYNLDTGAICGISGYDETYPGAVSAYRALSNLGGKILDW